MLKGGVTVAPTGTSQRSLVLPENRAPWSQCRSFSRAAKCPLSGNLKKTVICSAACRFRGHPLRYWARLSPTKRATGEDAMLSTTQPGLKIHRRRLQTQSRRSSARGMRPCHWLPPFAHQMFATRLNTKIARNPASATRDPRNLWSTSSRCVLVSQIQVSAQKLGGRDCSQTVPATEGPLCRP